MLKTVTPHDIERACLESGIDLRDLSNATGISEKELLMFGAGVHPLSARDRFQIIMVLTFSMPEDPSQSGKVSIERGETNGALVRQLLREMEEEKEEEWLAVLREQSARHCLGIYEEETQMETPDDSPSTAAPTPSAEPDSSTPVDSPLITHKEPRPSDGTLCTPLDQERRAAATKQYWKTHGEHQRRR